MVGPIPGAHDAGKSGGLEKPELSNLRHSTKVVPAALPCTGLSRSWEGTKGRPNRIRPIAEVRLGRKDDAVEHAWSAGKVLALSGGYWRTFALHAGVELELFTHLGDDALDGDVLAERLGVDERGLTALLNGLTSMGLLVRRGRAYANAPDAKPYLIRGAPEFVGDMILHHRHLVPAWSRLTQAVQTGRPVRDRPRSSEEREYFLRGMAVSARYIAPQLTPQIDLTGRRHLLDLGGGPGTYAAHFCLENPKLRATVFDLPDSEPVVRETIERFDLADRVGFQPGDYHADPIRGQYDVAWLSHILHGEGPEACGRIVRRAVSALKPGGILLIHEFILDDSLDGPLFPALFSLNMLVNTPAGRAYSEAQLRGMLTRGGMRDVKRLAFKGPNQSGILQSQL